MPESKSRRRRGRQGGSGSRSGRDLSIARPRRRKTNYWYVAASGIIAILVIGGFAIGGTNFGGQSGVAQTGSEQQPVEGIGEIQTVTSYEHVPVGEVVDYSSYPPTSGDHWPPGAQASCGFYEDGLPDERVVHNLEHGGIGVHYSCPEGCPELVEQLAKIVNRAASGALKVMMSPYPDMESRIALTAWTFIDQFEVLDEQRIKDFIDAHESSPNAPEYTAR